MIVHFSKLAAPFRRLGSEKRGSVVIETAIVAPMLILMSIGSFEISGMVARQHELQSGAAEAEAVALAANLGAETNANEMKAMLKESLDLNDDQVSVQILFRCDADADLVSSSDTCGESEDIVVSRYLQVQLTDTYKPTWAKIGIGKDFDYTVTRTVQLS